MAEHLSVSEDPAVLIPSQFHQERDLLLRPSLDQLLIVGLLILICAVRLLDLNYNTLFIDEASYVSVGRELLNGTVDPQALTWLSGSYLYPLLAAAVEQAGGVQALRGLSVLFSSGAAALVYMITAGLFSRTAGLWATLLFGMSGISIFVGQFAVFEALSTPLLAGAIYLVVVSMQLTGRRGWMAVVGASICLGLAVLVKYVLVIYIPAMALLLLALALSYNRPFIARLTSLLAPASAMLLLYGFANYTQLRTLVLGTTTFEAGTAADIFRAVWDEAGLIGILATVGGLALARKVKVARDDAVSWRIAWLMLGVLLTIALFALPIYHLITGNVRSVNKHILYTLVWLAPLAGVGCATLVAACKRYSGFGSGALRSAAGLSALAATVILCNQGFDRTWWWQHSWPNTTAALKALRATDTEGPMLVEGSTIYSYYLTGTATERQQWFSTWEFAYDGKVGVDAMEAAIRDQYFATVLLDDYYTPSVRARLSPALNEAGYREVFAYAQQLSSGDTILTTIYLRRAGVAE